MIKKSSSIRSLAVFLLITALCFSLNITGLADNQTSGKAPSNVILSWTGDTKSTITISWQTTDADNECYVKYSVSKTLENANTAKAEVSKTNSGIGMDYSIMRSALTGLSSATTYYYQVGGSSGWNGVSSFTTAAAKTQNFSFLYMGDVHMDETYGTLWGKLLNSAYSSNPGLAFGMLGGDDVDNGTRLSQWNSLFNAASPVYSAIPLMPTNGNHDSNFPNGKPMLYLDMFSLPQNGPDGFKGEFYSFDYGACHITVLNSWVFSGEQKLGDSDYEKINSWVANDLSSSSAEWKIVVMHNPVYSLVSDTVSVAVKKNWAPLFEAGGVSLVLCGHQHVYCRTYPLTEGSVDYDSGLTQIMGNASWKEYSSGDDRLMEKTVCNISNYQVVHINGDSLTVQSYDSNGNEIDECSLQSRSASVAFEDVGSSDWCADAIGNVVKNGLFSGTGKSTFSPDAPVTRAMFVTVLGRLAGITADNSSATDFDDVPNGLWYSGFVKWAEKNKIAAGISGRDFDPEGLITREQMAEMLYRYALFSGIDVKESSATALNAFSDAGDISPWALPAVKWSAEAGLMNGEGGCIYPQSSSTRAQAAQIISKYLSLEKGE